MDDAPEGRVEVIGMSGWGPDLGLVDGDGRFVEIVGPSCGATERSLYRVELRNGATTRPLRHEGEAVYYVQSGEAIGSDLDAGEEHELREGAMVHLDAGTTYHFRALEEAVLLGGPCPADTAMDVVVPDAVGATLESEEDR